MHLNYVPDSFPKSLRRILGIALMIAMTVQISGVYTFAGLFKPARAADTYLMYGVEDSGGADSQFFTLKPDMGTATALGPLYADYDIEAIDTHPVTGALYAIAGGGGDQDGKFFLVDKSTGSLTPIGDTGATESREIVSASFRGDGTLWAFQEDKGIMEVNLSTGALTMKAAANAHGVGDNWEGLAWDISGQQLYGAQGKELYRWDPVALTAVELCKNLPGTTEALDFRPDGKLFGGWHNAQNEALSIFEVDPHGCTIIPTNYQIPYRDVESIAFVINEPAKVCTMEIEKIGTPDEVKPGDDITYTVRIKNIGNANCTGGGVEFKEFYDPQTTFVSATPIPFQGNNLWNFGVVEPGEEHIVTIVVQASSSAHDGATLTNKACVWAEQFGNKDNPDNWVCDTATTKVMELPLGGQCELTILKTAAQDEVAPGGEIDYTVVLKNTGTADCTGGGVELKEFYDPQTTFVSAIPEPFQGNDLWNFGTIAPGEEHTVNITVAASDNAQEGDEIVNTVCAWAYEYGPHDDEESWICTEVTTKVKLPPPSGECRLLVQKSDDPDPVMPDAELAYTVQVQNTGDIACTDVVLTETYDARTMFAFAVPAPDPGETIWELGTLEPQEDKVIAITVTVGNTAENNDVLKNTACAGATELGPQNVCDEETTTVIKFPPSTAHLVITKQVTDMDEGPADTNTVSMGEQMTYTVTLENTGNFGAEEVVLTDDYDETKVTIEDAAGGTDDGANIVYQIGVINPGQSVTKEIKVTVKSGFTQNFAFDNIAEAKALAHPIINDKVTTTVTVPPPLTGFDLMLNKSVSPAVIIINQEAVFTITVTNEGTIGGTGITVKDVMPSELMYVSDSTDGDFDAATGIWTIGDLPQGGSTSASIRVRAATNGTFENRAEIITDGAQDDIDSIPNNQNAAEDDQDSAVLKVNELPGPPGGCAVNCGGSGGSPAAPKITVVKSASKLAVQAGDIVTYTFTVSAGGASDSQNVQVTDTLPAGFTFIEGATGTRTWNFGTMDEQTSKTESYDVLVGSTVAPGTYENIAVATISNATAPDNRSEARARVEVQSGGGGGGGSIGSPQLAIQKFATTSLTNPGAQVIYNVTVKNISSVAAKNTTVEDVLPAGFTFADGGGSAKAFVVGDLAAGQSHTLIYTVTVAADAAAGFHTNSATARADHAAPVSDRAEVEVRIIQVQGFTTLPDTGTGTMNPMAFTFISLIMLCIGALLAYRYRNILKETVGERVAVNFLRS